MENNFVLPLKELSPHLGGNIEDIDVREIGTAIPLECKNSKVLYLSKQISTRVGSLMSTWVRPTNISAFFDINDISASLVGIKRPILCLWR